MNDLQQARRVVRRSDYQPPDWRIETVDLVFDLDPERCVVHSRLGVRRNGIHTRALCLDGEDLELLELTVDGVLPEPNRLRRESAMLELLLDGEIAEVASRVAIRPAANTALEGLYASGTSLLTQCEAQGFRRITWFIDRPDVLARYTVELRADPARFPLLLSNGDLLAQGTLPDGRHFARWHDPYPKPSYLFALAAGRFEHLQAWFTTLQGRRVCLRVHADPGLASRGRHALNALIQAMAWDEAQYGRCCDLNRFNLVATQDFNLGAMENKGLNIFNARYLLVDPETATDDDFERVAAIVAHEYLHNWTGNRVTCRDWFQLALKEGLTVFREQQFMADCYGAAVCRIGEVRRLRALQFPEDAGPFAHAVRPEEYVAIDNFYTATVYEKGAEIVRMLHGVLGAAGFRAGMDEYFRRHDGQAVTCEDFLAALSAASGKDLAAFERWYAQAGTPRLRVQESYDADSQRYTLELAQSTAPTPGQPEKAALPIPVRLALFDAQGRRLPLRLTGESTAQGSERVVLLDAQSMRWVFEDLAEAPQASLLRGFSAPVLLERAENSGQLGFFARYEDDPVNRWDALQRLATHAVVAAYGQRPTGADWVAALGVALGEVLATPDQDPAWAAAALTPPELAWLSEQLDALDPLRLTEVRATFLAQLGRCLEERLAAVVDALLSDAGSRVDGQVIGRRRLKFAALGLLAWADQSAVASRVATVLERAVNLTDRLGALRLARWHGMDFAAAASAAFRARFDGDPLVLDHWFALEAGAPATDAVARVRQLCADPAFSWRNPNKVRAVFGSFTRANWRGFHAADGSGYALVAEAVRTVDVLNPQVAARLAGVFNGWRRLEPQRQAMMHATLVRLAAASASAELGEILDRALA